MKYIALAALLSVAACAPPADKPVEPSAPSPVAEAPPAAPPATPAPPSADAPLTPEGWGPLRVGMTRAEVVAAVGDTATPNAASDPDPNACSIFHPKNAPADLLVMIEEGKLSRVSATRAATLKTDKGFGIGDDAAAIKQAYGNAAQSQPHKYESAPAEYITVWSGGPRKEPYVQDAAARGINYTVDKTGKVASVHVGGPSIQLVEGCS